MITSVGALRTRWLSLGALVIGAAISVQAQTYSVTDLGVFADLPGKTESRPNAINSQGQVAGVNTAGGAYRALCYDGGSWTDLGTLGGPESWAGGIERSGRVAGYARLANGLMRGFLWTPGGTDGIPENPEMKELGTLGGDNSEAFAVNDSGQATGYSDLAAGTNPKAHAFVYANGKMTDIGKSATVLPNSFGYGINRLGHIAGTAYDAAYTAPRAFLYDGTRGVEIGALGGTGSTALSLNDADHVAGYITTIDYFDRAFHYANGVLTDLGTLGGHYSYGLGINNHNAIVGGSFVDAEDKVYHAFLYADGRMQDLNTLVDQTGLGWVLVEARAINDAGEIVGTGSYQGATHGFLLTPAATTQQPRITGISVLGPNLLLSFLTVAQKTYSVESCYDLPGGSWTELVPSIQGNGGIVSVTNVGGATQPYRFYRVKVSGG